MGSTFCAFPSGSVFSCGSGALFTGSTNIIFSNFFFKTGSHGTIYIFKNYFAIIFSVFSFQQYAIFKQISNVIAHLLCIFAFGVWSGIHGYCACFSHSQNQLCFAFFWSYYTIYGLSNSAKYWFLSKFESCCVAMVFLKIVINY